MVDEEKVACHLLLGHKQSSRESTAEDCGDGIFWSLPGFCTKGAVLM